MSTRSRRNAVDELEISSCPLLPPHPLDLSEEDVRCILKGDDKRDCVLYVLELESENYYVGRTKNLAKRIEDHLSGNADASCWTKMHRVVSLCKVRNCFDAAEEDALVFALMERVRLHSLKENQCPSSAEDKWIEDKCIDCVRGGNYSQPKREEEDRDSIKKKLRGNGDRCFECGDSEHFEKNCPQKCNNWKESSASPRALNPEITDSFARLNISMGKKKSNRSYQVWSEREEGQLRRYVQLKWTDTQIAEELGRTEKAIKLRKQKLGMG